jgi:hypothetical protein
MSIAPEPATSNTPGKGPFPTAGIVSWALVVMPFPRSITKSLLFTVSIKG